MLSFVVVSKPCHVGHTVDAMMCDPNGVGAPDTRRQHAGKNPVGLINIDDEPKPRQIVSATGENGVTTFLISGSSAALHNRERRAALARASSLLRQAGTALMALKAGSEEPETVSGALGELVDWLRRERERATAKPSPRQLIEGSGDKINSEQLTWTITSHLMTLTAIAA